MMIEETGDSGKLNFLERVRVALDPDFLVKRAQRLYLAQMIDIERKRSAFKAAEGNRLNANWTATGESINAFLRRELTTMRNRSRWLLRNVPNAISGMNAFTSYCIGTGIRPIATVYEKIKAKDDSGAFYFEQRENDLWNETCDDLWDAWAEAADVAGTQSSPESFYDVEELVLRKCVEDGEAFVHVVIDKSNDIVPMFVEFFEPESLDMNMTEAPGSANPIVMGVELDKNNNRPLAYWVRKSAKKGTQRYEAKYVFHVFKRLRPGQVRGFPWLHGVTDKFFQGNEFDDAMLTAVKIAACNCMFIERPKGMTPQGDLLPGTDGAQVLDADGNKVTHMQPGMVGTYPHGSEVKFNSPQLPGATFAMFNEHLDRKIGSGWQFGLSYEALTRNTSEASYAGGRLATQRDYQAFRQIIHFLNRKFNRPFRNLWVEIAVTAASIDAPGYFSMNPLTRHDRHYYARHEWIPPAWQYGVNPKDDVSASRDAMRAGMSTLDIECAFLGRDWRTVLRMSRKIKQTAERFGLNLTSDGSNSIQNGVEDDPSSEEDKAKTGNGKAATKPKATAKAGTS